MSLPPPDYRFASPTVHVTAWTDPVTDLMGHDPRSPYAERFWLPILGPSTTFLLRLVADRLDEAPDGFELSIDDSAQRLGLGTRSGLTSPFVKALARTGQFRLSQPCGPEALAIRRRLPVLTPSQISRLPVSVRDAHDAWQADSRKEPTVEQRRTRARRLALSLLELGETEEAAAQQLHRWRIHPAMAHEALRWAQIRRGERKPVPPPVPRPAAPVLVAADAPRTPVRPGTPNGVRPQIGATRPAPPTRFDPYDSPDAA